MSPTPDPIISGVPPTLVGKRHSVLLRVALLLVAVLALATRVPAPWRLTITNDEMHHLQSWRNRYGTNDIYPLFLDRVHQTHALSGWKMHLLENLYARSTLVQHLLLILVDPQPPLFPTLGEILAATTHSSLVALRLPSMLASLVTIYLLYCVGRVLRDAALGGWLAAMMTVCQLARIYAGIGRPYALAQCAVAATMLAYLLQSRHPDRSPWRFLLCALWAQATQWPAWLVISPMVLDVLVRCWATVGFLRFLRQCGWYAALSMLLLSEMVVQLHNPTIERMAGRVGWRMMLAHLGVGSPWADLGSFGAFMLLAVGFTFAVLAILGALLLFIRRDAVASGLRRPALILIVVAALCALGIYAAGSPVRFMNTYQLGPLLLTGIALRALLPNVTASVVGIILLAAAGVLLAALHPLNAFLCEFPDEQYYPAVAQFLAANLRPGDTWTSLPYFRAECLYRYAALPAPGDGSSMTDLRHLIANTTARHDTCFVFLLVPAPTEIPPEQPTDHISFADQVYVLKYAPLSPTTSTNKPRGSYVER